MRGGSSLGGTSPRAEGGEGEGKGSNSEEIGVSGQTVGVVCQENGTLVLQ